MKIFRLITYVLVSMSFIGSLCAIYAKPYKDYTSGNTVTGNITTPNSPEYDNLNKRDKGETDEDAWKRNQRNNRKEESVYKTAREFEPTAPIDSHKPTTLKRNQNEPYASTEGMVAEYTKGNITEKPGDVNY